MWDSRGSAFTVSISIRVMVSVVMMILASFTWLGLVEVYVRLVYHER